MWRFLIAILAILRLQGTSSLTVGTITEPYGRNMLTDSSRSILNNTLQLRGYDIVMISDMSADFDVDVLIADGLTNDIPPNFIAQIGFHVNCGKVLIAVGLDKKEISVAQELIYFMFGIQTDSPDDRGSISGSSADETHGIFQNVTIYIGTQNKCRVITTEDDTLLEAATFSERECVGAKIIYGDSSTGYPAGAVMFLQDGRLLDDNWVTDTNHQMFEILLDWIDDQVRKLHPDMPVMHTSVAVPVCPDNRACIPQTEAANLEQEIDDLKEELKMLKEFVGFPVEVPAPETAPLTASPTTSPTATPTVGRDCSSISGSWNGAPLDITSSETAGDCCNKCYDRSDCKKWKFFDGICGLYPSDAEITFSNSNVWESGTTV